MHNRIKKILTTIIIVAIWLVIWQIASVMTGLELLLASPVSVFKALINLIKSKIFYITLLRSAVNITLGFVAAFVLAVILGGISARFKFVEVFLKPPVLLMKTLPMTSFIILLLIWFGSSNVAVYISFIVAFPAVYVSVISGIRQIDRGIIQMMEVFRVPIVRRIRCTYISSIYPYVENALKTTMGMCWKAGVSAEVIGLVRHSIGEQLYYSKLYFMTADLFAWSIVVVVVSFAFEMLFIKLIRGLVKFAGRV